MHDPVSFGRAPRARSMLPMGTRRLPHVLLGLYVAVCLVALVVPDVFGAGSRIEPYVLGLPFAFFWYAAWATLTFVALTFYHRATDGGRE